MSAPSTALAPGGRVLLVGCGRLGTALGLRLAGSGHRVTAVRRTVAALPPVFCAVAADAGCGRLPALPPADAVVITLPPLGGPGRGNRAAAAVRAVAAALPALPGRTVLVSSTRVFDGAPPGSLITATREPCPASARAEALLETEATAAQALGAHVVRPSGIYGPGREALLRAVLEGRPVNHAKLTNRVHEEDLVRALQAMLTEPDPPHVLHASDAGPARLGDVLAFVARRLGTTPPPDTRAGDEGRIVDGAPLLALLGRLEYPDYRAGYAALIGAKA